MKKKVTLLNVITSVILQIVTILSGFIIPKIILNNFGSEVNGLVSSINQFLSYISLIEGGVTGVITASLYKPIVNKDYKKLSSLMKTTKNFYYKIGYIFIIYSIVLAIVYPLLFSSNFSYLFVSSLVLILSINLLIQYMFSLSIKTLLTADKKLYIVSITQTIIIILNIILAIISIYIYPSIHFLKIINGLLFIIQPIIFTKYVNNNYSIEKDVVEDKSLLENRWNGFAINIAAFIHFSTDITILTFFTNLATVSIYSVYALVTTGIRSIINAISSAISPTIGQALAKGNEDSLLLKMMNYEFLMFLIIYIVFSISALLIVPFVMIYTKGITDANYYQPLFALLLLLSEMIYLIKFPHLNLAYSANKFKEITKPAFIESGLNIIISLLLVKYFGIVGIAIGTIIGMIYRMIFQVSFTKQIIKSYSIKSFYKKAIIFSIGAIIYLIFCYQLIGLAKNNIVSWLEYGILYSIISIFSFGLISIVFYRKELTSLFNYLFSGIRGKK